MILIMIAAKAALLTVAAATPAPEHPPDCLAVQANLGIVVCGTSSTVLAIWRAEEGNKRQARIPFLVLVRGEPGWVARVSSQSLRQPDDSDKIRVQAGTRGLDVT